MARPKKAEEKPRDSEMLEISVADFVHTRDSVVTGLAKLHSAISDLSHAYIAHTDTVIGRGNAPSLEQLNIANPLSGENGLFSARGPTPAPTTEVVSDGKKRKRAPHDKNAPKRALTPFFLFLQTERQRIAEQMGEGHTAKEVQDEGGRRWREMSEEGKAVWQYKYGVNFARYRERNKAYKAGQPIPDISDEQAKALYEKTAKEGKLPKSVGLDVAQIDTEDDSETSDASSSSEEESPEPQRPPPSKRAKGAKEVTVRRFKQTPVKEPERILVEQKSKSPEKKKGSKKRAAKAIEEPAELMKEVVAEPESPPAKQEKQKRKKRKSEA